MENPLQQEEPGSEAELNNSGKSETAKPPKHPNRRGRHADKFTSYITSLYTNNGNQGNVESLRTSTVRAVKNCIRRLEDSKGPPANVVPYQDELQGRVWQAMGQLVRQHPDLFKHKGSTAAGTAIDVRAIRLREHLPESKYRSFNNAFCRDFYAEEPIRQFHFLYVLLIFGTEVDPQRLSKELKMACSGTLREQVAVWTSVRHYLTFEMFRKLDLKPYFEEIPRNDDHTMDETFDPYEVLA